MTPADDLATLIRRLVSEKPLAAILLGEILGPPVGAETTRPKQWET